MVTTNQLNPVDVANKLVELVEAETTEENNFMPPELRASIKTSSSKRPLKPEAGSQVCFLVSMQNLQKFVAPVVVIGVALAVLIASVVRL